MGLMSADAFGLSDPYCEVIVQAEDIGRQMWRTRFVAQNLFPTWFEAKDFPVDKHGPVYVLFRVMDRDTGCPPPQRL